MHACAKLEREVAFIQHALHTAESTVMIIPYETLKVVRKKAYKQRMEENSTDDEGIAELARRHSTRHLPADVTRSSIAKSKAQRSRRRRYLNSAQVATLSTARGAKAAPGERSARADEGTACDSLSEDWDGSCTQDWGRLGPVEARLIMEYAETAHVHLLEQEQAERAEMLKNDIDKLRDVLAKGEGEELIWKLVPDGILKQEIPEQVVQRAQLAFATIDTNKCGRVQFQDLGARLVRAGFSPANAVRLFMFLDSERDGALTLDNFVSGFAALCKQYGAPEEYPELGLY